jgi:hypothetical protein
MRQATEAYSANQDGWTGAEGLRPYLGALLVGYNDDDGKLIHAGRVGTGTPAKCSRICADVSIL